MTRKYHVASSAMAPRRVGPRKFGALDFAAKKVINENARVSDVYISPQGSVEMNIIKCIFGVILTHRIGVGCLCTLFLWVCAAQSHTDGMRQEVLVGVVELHMDALSET